MLVYHLRIKKQVFTLLSIKGLHKLIMNAKRVTVVELYILPHIKQWGCMKEGAIPPLPINI